MKFEDLWVLLTFREVGKGLNLACVMNIVVEETIESTQAVVSIVGKETREGAERVFVLSLHNQNKRCMFFFILNIRLVYF